jgi:A/G-specific adenine glycosylase
MNDFAKHLLDWYKTAKRPLPWRENPDPYWIYLSEIMLQQTRMESALPYFETFIRELPTLKDLSMVDDDRLMKLWEGLGYYSRARNLKKGAIYIMEEFDGILPSDPKELQKIPGIGPYSAGAIASTLYQKPVSAVDGNVLRVFSRLYRLEETLPSAALTRAVREKVLELIPAEAPGDFNQALMELGALICKPTSPACSTCPVRAFCQSAEAEDVAEFPRRKKKSPPRREHHTVLLLECNAAFAVERKEKGLLKGLYHFPMLKGHLSTEEVRKTLQKEGFVVRDIFDQGEASHVFSHRIWQMRLYHVMVDNSTEHFEWFEKKRLADLPVASAFRSVKMLLDL